MSPARMTCAGSWAVYLALKEIAAATMSLSLWPLCFDLSLALQNTACFGSGPNQTEDGIVAACEGSIISALGTLLPV